MINFMHKYRNWLPFFVLLAALIILHQQCFLRDDDLVFSKQTLSSSFLLERYMTWSSRVIIESVLIIVLHLPFIIWELMDILLTMGLCMGLSYLFVPKEQRCVGNWAVVVLYLLYPFEQLSNAGWVATTVNYLWPVAFTVFAMLPLRLLAEGKEISRRVILFAALAMIFAQDAELCWIILAMAYGGTVAVCGFRRQYRFFIGTQLLITIVMFLKIIFCPGNHKRYISEIYSWFPDYEKITVFDRLDLSLTSTVGHFFVLPDIMMFVFGIVLVLLVWQCQKNWLWRLFACMPLLLKSVCCWAAHSGGRFWIPLRHGNAVDIMSADYAAPYAALSISVFFFVFVIVALYLAYGNTKQAIMLIGVFLIGEATSLAMMFSPTMFASMDRYFYPFHLAIVVLAVRCICTLYMRSRSIVRC